MATVTPISAAQFRERRKALKNKRRSRTFLALLRGIGIIGLATGAFWLVTLPNWVLHDSSQIRIEGNQFLSEEEIRSLIPLSYPQPLLSLSVSELQKNLQQRVPVESTTIVRRIVPPSLTITVRERQPVAIAIAPVVSPETKQKALKHIGYLDRKGVLVGAEFYQNFANKTQKPPSLQIIGIPEQYLPYWETLHDLVQQAEVDIEAIDWQDPNNLILKTGLGKVYVGAYTSKFPQQLMMLGKIKRLTQAVPPTQIVHIDLLDPAMPSVKQKQPPKSKEDDSSS